LDYLFACIFIFDVIYVYLLHKAGAGAASGLKATTSARA